MKINYKKTAAIFINFVLMILVITGLFVAFTMLPIKGNFRLFSVMSGSMEPFIATGSVVLVKPMAGYGPGDIITFISPQSTTSRDTTTHRIVSVEEENGQMIFTTKGDANSAPDAQMINGERIIGGYVTSVAGIGYLLGYLKTLPGLIILIIIPATLIIYEEIKKIYYEVRAINKEKREILRSKT